jgi:hypothetical protein
MTSLLHSKKTNLQAHVCFSAPTQETSPSRSQFLEFLELVQDPNLYMLNILNLDLSSQ